MRINFLLIKFSAYYVIIQSIKVMLSLFSMIKWVLLSNNLIVSNSLKVDAFKIIWSINKRFWAKK